MGSEKKAIWKVLGGRKSAFSVQASVLNGPAPALVVEIKGDIKNKGEMISYAFCLEDMTGGQVNEFMWNRNGEISLVESMSMTSKTMKVGADYIVPEWTKVLTVPLNNLQFAQQGDRTLKASILVNGAPASASVNVTYVQSERGFRDLAEAKQSLYSALFCLIAGFRYDFPVYAGRAVTMAADWLLAESAGWESSEREAVFERFRCLAESTPPVVNWERACNEYAVALRDQANTEFRNGVVRLFYSILMDEESDGSSDTGLTFFYALFVAIGMDMSAFSSLADKLIMTCDLSKHHPDSLLGLHDAMSGDEMKKRLRDEYKRWNDRVTHSDTTVREKATYMLEIISDRRRQLSA